MVKNMNSEKQAKGRASTSKARGSIETSAAKKIPGLTDPDRDRLSGAKPEIIETYAVIGKSYFSLGKLLRNAKGEIKPRVFGAWVDAELPFGNRSAQTYMRLDKVLGEHANALASLELVTLDALADPKLTDDARAEIIEDVASGKLTRDDDVMARIASSPGIKEKREEREATRVATEKERHEALVNIAVTIVDLAGDQLGALVPLLRNAGLADLLNVIDGLVGLPEDGAPEHIGDGKQSDRTGQGNNGDSPAAQADEDGFHESGMNASLANAVAQPAP